MRVIVAPGAQAAGDDLVASVARSLAGPEGEVVSLAVAGLAHPSRSLTPAQVHMVRAALLGRDPSGRDMDSERDGTRVGYVCTGQRRGATALRGAGADRVVAVVDHLGLSWDSPLRGPNDDGLGPRFPRTDAVYVPETVQNRLRGGPGVTIPLATVVGVRDDKALTEWEREMVDALDLRVVSVELVPVAVIAAHLGLRLAAAVVLQA